MKADHWLYVFFLIWYGCGVILLGFDILPVWLEWANVVFLMVAGLLGGVYFYHTYGKALGTALSLSVIFLSIFAEHLGVEYGILFGDYYYTRDFGPQLMSVPIAIGFAWLMIIAGSHALLKAVLPEAPAVIFSAIGALLAVMIDLIIDPVAYEVKNYWVWTADSFYYNIPFSNFSGWFITAFVLHMIIQLAGKKTFKQVPLWQNRIVLVYFLVLFMFVLLAAIHFLWLAVAFTVIPAAAVLSVYILSVKRGSHDRSQQKQVV
ncbi:carotenoid biosynthesis protein [Bacillus sp. FJAT-42376]|uniref:carotenoid biosynthesis protein n=1 Tax=Bacillus sp. FJAT-42376 TaxID=2014076 RepID=UPI000F50B809|nr:carotenoid biosynthesis protein [Bacillus sp. FJAT-42376]AZB42302.1 carotenoid biosynthesis protein [Bacillus sp. FJAT-42376]